MMISVATLLLLLGTIQLGYGQFLLEKKCNHGWTYMNIMGFKDTCILIPTQMANFFEASFICDRLDGAHLVELPSRLSVMILQARFRAQLKGKKVWIGLTDLETEGIFKWFNQKKAVAFTENSFAPNQALIRDPHKNCVFMDEKGLWYVESCLAKFNFICQK